ncbi:MAG: PEP-CTERM sorting domain-containing protein [Phycisphaerae bacterium]
MFSKALKLSHSSLLLATITAVASAGMTSLASADITGFGNGSGWTFNSQLTPNGVPGVSGGVLTVTQASNSETSSAFYNSQQAIGHFSAAFTYQNVSGNGADGITFTVQNATAGVNALGGNGYNLGYGGDPGTSFNTPITNSVAYGIELWPNTAGSYGGFGQDGAINANGSTAPAFTSTSPVNAELTDKINFAITYNGTTLSVNMTDPTTGKSYSTSEVVDIPTVVGSSLAYVGFTGGTGGANTEQQISNFSYTTVPEPATLGLFGVGGAIVGMLLLKRRRTV